MTIERCMELAPNWAAQTYEPIEPPKQPKFNFGFGEWFNNFKRQNGIALLLLFAWAASMMIGCCLTGVIVRKRTTKEVTERVTSEMRASFQEYLDDLEEKQRASQFLSGDASFEQAVIEFADWFDELIATYSMEFGLTEDALRTLGWTYIARVIKASPEFGKTPQEIIEKAGAWEGKVVGHAVRPQDTALAQELSRAFLSGQYPDGFTQDMTFGARETGGGFVARNEFITGPNTVYWRYGK